MDKTLANIREIPDRVLRFKELAELYSALAGAESVRVIPYRAPGLPFFSRLNPKQQDLAIHQLTLALEVFEEMQREGLSLRDSPKLLWRSLGKLGLTPQPDVFDKITEESVVEVYSDEQKQIFRNLRFFEFVSYSLEEVFGTEWWIMSRRDPLYAGEIYRTGRAIMTGQISTTVDPGIGEHLFEETASAELLKIMIKIQYMSPVRQEGRVAGALIINTSRIVGSTKGESRCPKSIER